MLAGMVRGAAQREHARAPAQARAPVIQTGITRSLSATELKLEALQKEHERLLRDIAKRKAACELAEQAARDAASAFEQRVDPLRVAFFQTLKELREIFGALLGSESRLNKRDRARVRRLYQELMPDLGEADPEPDFSGNDGAEREHAERDFDPFSRSEPPRDERASDPGFSAPRPAEKGAGVLRAVFRRLAIALHPDKVQDSAEKDKRTAVMKDITRAYESGDVARLLELERSWLAATPVADDDQGGVLRRVAALLGANTELRKQLRALTAQLKNLKLQAPRPPARRSRSRSRTGVTPPSETDRLVSQIERELEKVRALRDLAQSFRDGSIGIDELLRGPVSSRSSQEDELLELLAQVIEEAQEAEPYERRRAAKRRRSSR
jgi:hypothetical protein